MIAIPSRVAGGYRKLEPLGAQLTERLTFTARANSRPRMCSPPSTRTFNGPSKGKVSTTRTEANLKAWFEHISELDAWQTTEPKR